MKARSVLVSKDCNEGEFARFVLSALAPTVCELALCATGAIAQLIPRSLSRVAPQRVRSTVNQPTSRCSTDQRISGRPRGHDTTHRSIQAACTDWRSCKQTTFETCPSQPHTHAQAALRTSLFQVWQASWLDASRLLRCRSRHLFSLTWTALCFNSLS